MPTKIPGRKPSDSSNTTSNSVRVALRAADGTLRELGEKDLYLETDKHKILKFRMLAKTQFRDKEGENVRDSLVKPGDQLSVQVSADDPETALRVILNRAGTQAEKTAAARPFDHDSAKAPVEADTHSAGSMEVGAEPSRGSTGSSKTSDSGAGDQNTTASVNPPADDDFKAHAASGSRRGRFAAHAVPSHWNGGSRAIATATAKGTAAAAGAKSS